MYKVVWHDGLGRLTHPSSHPKSWDITPYLFGVDRDPTGAVRTPNIDNFRSDLRGRSGPQILHLQRCEGRNIADSTRAPPREARALKPLRTNHIPVLLRRPIDWRGCRRVNEALRTEVPGQAGFDPRARPAARARAVQRVRAGRAAGGRLGRRTNRRAGHAEKHSTPVGFDSTVSSHPATLAEASTEAQ